MNIFSSRIVPLLVFSVFLSQRVVAADAASFLQDNSPVPAENWKIESKPGDDVQMKAENGCLVIDYKVTVGQLHQLGDVTYPTGSFDLLLRQPAALPANVDRIVFEAVGSELKAWNARYDQVRLRPLIRDSHGTVFVYNGFADESFPFPSSAADALRWRRWMTRQFLTSEAGAATQDIFETRGDAVNGVPEGALTFLGFEGEIRTMKPSQKSGQFILGGYSFVGGHAPVEDPWFFADAVCKDSGDYRLGYEVRDSFQGKPIREGSQKFTFDPNAPASRRQVLRFPLGPSGDYWVSYQLTSPDGSVGTANNFRMQVYDQPGAPLPATDMTKAPAVGRLRINPVAHTEGVYGSDEPMTVTLRLFGSGKGSESLAIKWQMLSYEFPDVLDQGEKTVEVTGSGYHDVPLKLTPKPGRDAYRLKITVEENGKTVDDVTYQLGRKTVFATTTHPRPTPLCDRTFIKAGSYNTITMTSSFGTHFKSEDEAVKFYSDRMDQIQKITPYVIYIIDIRDLQTLPGVYNFSLLDRLMDAAAGRGMGLMLRIDHIDTEGQFNWEKYARQLNYDGREISEYFYGGFAVTDKGYTQVWLDAFRAIYNRYGAHPAFQGYYLLQPAGEFTVSDKPYEGLISGYAPTDREFFRTWLRDSMKYSLPDLNKRWGTNYATWDDVMPPQPDFTVGEKPDLRASWIDFCRFKNWLNSNYWHKTAVTSIRSYDPWHVVIAHGEPRMAEGLADYGHNGGNHFFENIGSYMNTWYEHDTGWITEPHQPNKWADYGDPGERGWVLDWSIWIAFAQAGGGAANLHVYYHPKLATLIEHYGGDMAYDRMQRYYPILQELHDIKMTMHPTEVAFLSDPSTLFTKHHTIFPARGWDLKRWDELLDRDNVNYKRINGDIGPDDLKGVKLIVGNVLDEVMSGTNINAISDAVHNGAKLVMTANTGEYSPEFPTDQFVLLKKLGIDPPQGKYVTDDANVKASAAGSDNPIFGAGDSIRFFSLTDYKNDQNSEAIRKDFWEYPYRFLPMTNYFGYYPDNQEKGGTVLATFPNGAPAVSVYPCGSGEVLVFWGLPDYKPDNIPGFMAKAAHWAGADTSVSTNPLPFMREGSNDVEGRHYALLFNTKAGTYRQKIEFLKDGDYFVDEMVSDQRLGKVSGKDAREQGINLTFDPSYSPLKILRFIPMSAIHTKHLWQDKYGDLDEPAASK